MSWYVVDLPGPAWGVWAEFGRVVYIISESFANAVLKYSIGKDYFPDFQVWYHTLAPPP